jgi:hypothetical protein
MVNMLKSYGTKNRYRYLERKIRSVDPNPKGSEKFGSF